MAKPEDHEMVPITKSDFMQILGRKRPRVCSACGGFNSSNNLICDPCDHDR